MTKSSDHPLFNTSTNRLVSDIASILKESTLPEVEEGRYSSYHDRYRERGDVPNLPKKVRGYAVVVKAGTDTAELIAQIDAYLEKKAPRKYSASRLTGPLSGDQTIIVSNQTDVDYNADQDKVDPSVQEYLKAAVAGHPGVLGFVNRNS